MKAPLALDPAGQAVSAARRYVRECLDALDAEELSESAELGVSELVTNAILHGRTAFTISVRQTPSGPVRVEVADGSPIPPQQRRVNVFATTGRGLRLVASVSSAWGMEARSDGGVGKTVWFEPAETSTATAFMEADWSVDIDGLLPSAAEER